MLDFLVDVEEPIVSLDPLDEDLLQLLPEDQRVRHTNPARAKNLVYVLHVYSFIYCFEVFLVIGTDHLSFLW